LFWLISLALQTFSLRYGGTQLHFGPGTVEKLRGWVSQFRRVYIVTGRRSAKVCGALDDVVKILSDAGVAYEHFNEVSPNPTTSMVHKLAERAWRFGAEAFIAIGGGSPIDTAKLASVIVECGGEIQDYIKGRREVCGSIPVAAINITHGTGTEVDRYAVTTIEETKEKLSLAHPAIYPAISIDDPRYLRTLPRNQTVYTTLDALYHAIESATTVDSPPIVAALAEEAVMYIARYLPRALENPEDLEARYWLLYASMVAGIAIDLGRTHLVHAIEHALSGIRPELAHGCGLAIVGPKIVELTYRARPETLHRLLKHLDPSLRPVPDDAPRAAEAVRRFQKSVGFDERLRNYGFSEADEESVVKLTMESLGFLVRLAPFEVTPEIVKEVFRSSL